MIKEKTILLISNQELTTELKLACSEIMSRGLKLSSPQKITRALEILKASEINTVIINASDFKLEVFELCRDIKELFRSSIDVFVYLPNASLSEAAKFGKLNAQIEDQKTILDLVNKLNPDQERSFLIDENISSVYSLNGGCGSSFISILLAQFLSNMDKNTLLMESSNKFSIKEILGFNTGLALLSRDRSRELNQSKDLEWLSTFIHKTPRIAKMSYLNLFNTLQEKQAYADRLSISLQSIINKFDDLALASNKNQQELKFHSEDDISQRISLLSNSLKLLAKELEGNSFAVFEEIIQLGTKISSNVFFDLSSDLTSPINKQFLKFSKNIIIVFRDSFDIKTEYQKQKQFFAEHYKLNVIPVIAPNQFQMKYCLSLKDSDWLNIMGEKPLIYPYALEEVTRFIFDKEEIAQNHALMNFTRDLLLRLGFSFNELNLQSAKGVLKLLKR